MSDTKQVVNMNKTIVTTKNLILPKDSILAEAGLYYCNWAPDEICRTLFDSPVFDTNYTHCVEVTEKAVVGLKTKRSETNTVNVVRFPLLTADDVILDEQGTKLVDFLNAVLKNTIRNQSSNILTKDGYPLNVAFDIRKGRLSDEERARNLGFLITYFKISGASSIIETIETTEKFLFREDSSGKQALSLLNRSGVDGMLSDCVYEEGFDTSSNIVYLVDSVGVMNSNFGFHWNPGLDSVTGSMIKKFVSPSDPELLRSMKIEPKTIYFSSREELRDGIVNVLRDVQLFLKSLGVTAPVVAHEFLDTSMLRYDALRCLGKAVEAEVVTKPDGFIVLALRNADEETMYPITNWLDLIRRPSRVLLTEMLEQAAEAQSGPDKDYFTLWTSPSSQ